MLTAERKARHLLAERLVVSSESEAKDEASQEGTTAGEGNRIKEEQHGADELLTGEHNLYEVCGVSFVMIMLQGRCHQSLEYPTDGRSVV